MRRAAAGLFVLLALAATLGVGAASAQDDTRLGIREVDATNAEGVEVTFFYSGDRDNLKGLTVRDGDRVVNSSSAVPLDDQQAIGIVLLIDASQSMEENALIERVKEAALTFVEEKAVTDEIAVVSFNSEVRVEQEFTTDKNELIAAIDKIALAPTTGLYDGIVRSAALFEDTTLQPNIVVFSDGEDAGSSANASQAQGAVEARGAALFAIGVANPGFQVLESMATDTGGTSGVASNASTVDTVFAEVQASLRKQYVVTYASSEDAGTVQVTLSVGSQQATAEYAAGSVQAGASSLRPQPVDTPSGPAFLRGSGGLLLAIVLAGLAAVVIVYMIGTSFFGRENSLGQALRPYSEGYVAAEAEEDEGDGKRGQKLVQTPLLQRAVDATGKFADRQGFLTKVEARLEQANLPLRPAEALFFYAAGVALLALLLLALLGNPIGAILITVLVALVPPAVVSTMAGRRRKAFNSLLPDTLQLLASTLRAGFSLMQGVEAVSREVSEPVGRELRRVVTESRLGRPLEESLDGVSARMGSADFGWATMAIRIQREVGGNLAELLVTVAETMTERERLRRDVNALVAEGKISAYVLGLLPFGLGFFIYASNPDYMKPLFEETIGKGLMIGAVTLMLVGFYWMKKTIEIDI